MIDRDIVWRGERSVPLVQEDRAGAAITDRGDEVKIAVMVQIGGGHAAGITGETNSPAPSREAPIPPVDEDGERTCGGIRRDDVGVVVTREIHNDRPPCARPGHDGLAPGLERSIAIAEDKGDAAIPQIRDDAVQIAVTIEITEGHVLGGGADRNPLLGTHPLQAATSGVDMHPEVVAVIVDGDEIGISVAIEVTGGHPLTVFTILLSRRAEPVGSRSGHHEPVFVVEDDKLRGMGHDANRIQVSIAIEIDERPAVRPAASRIRAALEFQDFQFERPGPGRRPVLTAVIPDHPHRLRARAHERQILPSVPIEISHRHGCSRGIDADIRGHPESADAIVLLDLQPGGPAQPGDQVEVSIAVKVSAPEQFDGIGSGLPRRRDRFSKGAGAVVENDDERPVRGDGQVGSAVGIEIGDIKGQGIRTRAAV